MPEAGREIVSDTGPLISFEKLGGSFGLLRRLYHRVLVPPEVLAELSEGLPGGGAAYVRLHDLRGLLVVVVAPTGMSRPDLDPGEAASIALAEARGLPLLIEERVGRRVATERGIAISGAAGQVRRAFLQGVLTRQEAFDHLRQLFEAGRINGTVLQAVSGAISRDGAR